MKLYASVAIIATVLFSTSAFAQEPYRGQSRNGEPNKQQTTATTKPKPKAYTPPNNSSPSAPYGTGTR